VGQRDRRLVTAGVDIDAALAFRPLTRADFPMLVRWFAAPHVRRWFPGRASLDDVAAELGPVADAAVHIHGYIATVGEHPVGLVQWERMGDDAELQGTYGVEDPNTANCDVLLGEAAHQGLGARLIRQFLESIVFADPRVTTCLIDPETDNAIAIRAYEKAGFRFVRALADDGEGGSVYLMELSKGDLAAPAHDASPFFVRPGRPEEIAIALGIDADACEAFKELSPELDVALSSDHPFVVAEVAAWREAARHGRLLFACTPDRVPVGFAVLGLADGRPHLVQISVRRAFMGRGVGRALVTRAKRWSVRAGELWLTTYAGVPWNQPWYERLGFVATPEAGCGPELRAALDAERAALPRARPRVAMVYRHPQDGRED
jgi:GNAT superfamily N-acetyltransferase